MTDRDMTDARSATIARDILAAIAADKAATAALLTTLDNFDLRGPSMNTRRTSTTAARQRTRKTPPPLTPLEFTRTQRETEIRTAPKAEAVWLAAHHIREARAYITRAIPMVRAPLKGFEGVMAGPLKHRMRVLRELPDSMSARMGPALKVARYWDLDGKLSARYERWCAQYAATVGAWARIGYWDATAEAFEQQYPPALQVLDDMLSALGDG